MAERKVPIAVAKGDGIGPEITDAVMRVIEAAGANIEVHAVEIGEKVYLEGFSNGIRPETWEILASTEAFLKAPITTPQGGGFKSINVNIRTTLGLYANIRPCRSFHPFVKTKHPGMDVIIVRENEEDLYAGIEYAHSPDSAIALKVMTRSGSERIIHYAFEYARAHERKKVTCFTKDNILKLSDGLFHRVFDEVSAQYSDIENEHWIVDIGAAKLADTPEAFDVVVLPNLYGDILSDVAAQIAGSVGLAGSANIGTGGAMFEAIHGSAPRRANQNLANPSGLLNGAILMLIHIGQPEIAERIHNAWLVTLERGIHTYDIYKEGISRQKVGTREFADAIISHLGRRPEELKAVSYSSTPTQPALRSGKEPIRPSKQLGELVGIDLFIEASSDVESLQRKVSALNGEGLSLVLITNRGAKVWPDTHASTNLVDQWRCRFTAETGAQTRVEALLALQARAHEAGVQIVQTQHLYRRGDEAGYSLAEYGPSK